MRFTFLHRLVIAFGISALVAHVEPETLPHRLSEQAYALGLLKGRLSARSDVEALAEVEAAHAAQAYRKSLALAQQVLVRFPARSEVRLIMARNYRALGEPLAAAEVLLPLVGSRFEGEARLAAFEAWLAAGEPERAMRVLRGAGGRSEYVLGAGAPVLIPTTVALPRLVARPLSIQPIAPPAPVESGFTPPLLPENRPVGEPQGPAVAAEAPAERVAREEVAGEVAALFQKYWAGDYEAVVRDGPALVLQYPNQPELRLAVANSLAWSGRLPAAIEMYRPLLDTPLRPQALLGLGNSYRWQGRPSRAASLIGQAARARPDDPEVQKAQRLLARELRPRTRGQIEYAADSTEAERTSVGALHRAWTDNYRTQIEAGVSTTTSGRDGLDVSWDTLGLALEQPEAPLSPRMHVEYQQHHGGRLFGGIRAEHGPLSVSLERRDWGLADPRAAQDGLRAAQFALDLAAQPAAGKLWGSYDHYWISDGNRIQEASLEFTPAWQPWSDSPLKWFAAFYGREAERADPRYWSPADGYYTLGPGLKAEGGDAASEWYASTRLGLPLTDSSSTSWNAAVGGRRWLSERVAAGADLFYTHSSRDDTRYDGFTAGTYLEVLW